MDMFLAERHAVPLDRGRLHRREALPHRVPFPLPLGLAGQQLQLAELRLLQGKPLLYLLLALACLHVEQQL